MEPAEIVQVVKDSGLRGRGAGYAPEHDARMVLVPSDQFPIA